MRVEAHACMQADGLARREKNTPATERASGCVRLHYMETAVFE